jgi:acyl carrier protein
VKKQIIESIYAVIDETNRQALDDRPLTKSLDTVLSGGSGELDSLGLIRFVTATEERIESTFGKSIVLIDDRALSQAISPFSSVGALVTYIEGLLREHA